MLCALLLSLPRVVIPAPFDTVKCSPRAGAGQRAPVCTSSTACHRSHVCHDEQEAPVSHTLCWQGRLWEGSEELNVLPAGCRHELCSRKMLAAPKGFLWQGVGASCRKLCCSEHHICMGCRRKWGTQPQCIQGVKVSALHQAGGCPPKKKIQTNWSDPNSLPYGNERDTSAEIMGFVLRRSPTVGRGPGQP